MTKEIITTKIERQTLQKLKVVAALTKETMTEVLNRLIDAELERVQQQYERLKK